MSEGEKPLEGLLDHVDAAVGENGEQADLKAIVESFGDRAFGPVLTLCGLFLITPLGAIPGVPIALGLIIISFAIQLLLGRDHPWMPRFIEKVIVKRAKVKKTKQVVRPVLRKVDGVVRPRLAWATGKPARYMAALISIILAITLFPLGAVPFGVAIPGAIICILGLGILARDGIIMIIGFTLTGGASVLIYSLIMGTLQ